LYVAYRDDAAVDDSNLRWRRGQGCVGRVLDTGRTVIGDDVASTGLTRWTT
jgi:hypothetical protein